MVEILTCGRLIDPPSSPFSPKRTIASRQSARTSSSLLGTLGSTASVDLPPIYATASERTCERISSAAHRRDLPAATAAENRAAYTASRAAAAAAAAAASAERANQAREIRANKAALRLLPDYQDNTVFQRREQALALHASRPPSRAPACATPRSPETRRPRRRRPFSASFYPPEEYDAPENRAARAVQAARARTQTPALAAAAAAGAGQEQTLEELAATAQAAAAVCGYARLYTVVGDRVVVSGDGCQRRLGAAAAAAEVELLVETQRVLEHMWGEQMANVGEDNNDEIDDYPSSDPGVGLEYLLRPNSQSRTLQPASDASDEATILSTILTRI